MCRMLLSVRLQLSRLVEIEQVDGAASGVFPATQWLQRGIEYLLVAVGEIGESHRENSRKTKSRLLFNRACYSDQPLTESPGILKNSRLDAGQSRGNTGIVKLDQRFLKEGQA